VARLEADLVGANSEATARELAYRRKAGLSEHNIVSQGDYEEAKSRWEIAKAELTQAEGLLLAAGLTRDDLARILEEGKIGAQFELRAPAGGTLVQSRVSLGELVHPGVSLATISRPDHIWVEASVSANEALRVEEGARLEFISGGGGAERSIGEVVWVSRFLDPVTRTATVRAKVISDPRSLRPGQYGRAMIHTGKMASAVLVPKDAVQWEGCCNVVFVQESPERFRPRKVTIDTADDGYYRVASGLNGGEQVVVRGSHLLKTELRKGNLGTGCCGLEPEA
jgi:cobalt-zinc-cadmium efflux system membrane fusion protein